MITIRKEIELKYKPEDKFPGCNYWFSGETFKDFMDKFIDSEYNFLLKGIPHKERTHVSLVSADPVDIIGYVKEYTERSITVELNVGIINKGLLALIMKNKLKASPVIIVSGRDQVTNEVFRAKVIAFELVCDYMKESD